jgi:phosphate starvation-inducible PhoH-like protein
MKPDVVEFSLRPEDNRRLANLCGAMDENLHQIEAAFDVAISRRGSNFRVNGEKLQAEKGAQAIEHFYKRANDNLNLDDIPR